MPDEQVSGQVGEGQGHEQPQSSGGWRESLGPLGKEKLFDVFKGNDWKEIGPVMAKSYYEAQKMLGGSIRLPKPDSSPEEKKKAFDEIYSKLGRPSKPEEYKVPEIEGIRWTEELLKPALNEFHKLGLTAEQADGILRLYGKVLGQNVQNIRERHNQAVEALKKEWGVNYDRKVVLAQRALNQLGDEELKKFIDETGIGDNPHLVKFFAEIGEILAEDGIISGRVEGELSKSEIERKLKEMLGDPKHPINNLRHPAHADALAEYNKLNRSLLSAKD